MSLNYKADDVGAPTLYGIDGVSGGPGGLAKANIATSSATITWDATLLDKWITICPRGTKIYVRFVKSTDSPTAVTTDVPVADGEKFQFRLTKFSQQMAFIGDGAVTNGLTHWMSENTQRIKQ